MTIERQVRAENGFSLRKLEAKQIKHCGNP